MPKPSPGTKPDGSIGGPRAAQSSRFVSRWTRLLDCAWSPTFWGGGDTLDNAVRVRNRARIRPQPFYSATLDGGFQIGRNTAFVTDHHGSGLAYDGTANSWLAASLTPWTPFTQGGFQAGTMFALFKRTGAYVTNSRSVVYAVSRVAALGGDPVMFLRASANCQGLVGNGTGAYGVPTLTGFSAGIGELICLAFSSRTATDHEVVGYNFTTGQFASATDTTNIGSAVAGAGADPDREALGTYVFNSTVSDVLVGNTYLAGFAPFGFTSAELAEVVMDPWAQFEPQFSPLISQFAQLQAARSRIIWM